MKILVQAISKTLPKKKFCRSENGFTLLEILVVLTLGLLIFGTVLPQFFSFFSKPIEKEFKHINAVLKTLRNDAVLKNTAYCLLFDLNLQQVMISEEINSGKCSKEFFVKPESLKPHEFKEDLILREAKLVGSNSLVSGENKKYLEVHINSSGFVTPFLLMFTLPELSKTWVIETKGIMGKLQIREK